MTDTPPQRIRLSRARGARKPPDAVTVSRGTRWGNPYPVADYGRDHALSRYRQQLNSDPDHVAAIRHHLHGRDLACWCRRDEHCHADVLLTIAAGGAVPTTQPDPPEGTHHAA